MTRARVAALLSTMAVSVGLLTGRPRQCPPARQFTHNTYVGFTVSADSIEVDHVLDLAEIPTFQERSAADVDGDGTVSSTNRGGATLRVDRLAHRRHDEPGPVALSVDWPSSPSRWRGRPADHPEVVSPRMLAATFDATADVAQGRRVA